jgi:hypothetical protein
VADGRYSALGSGVPELFRDLFDGAFYWRQIVRPEACQGIGFWFHSRIPFRSLEKLLWIVNKFPIELTLFRRNSLRNRTLLPYWLSGILFAFYSLNLPHSRHASKPCLQQNHAGEALSAKGRITGKDTIDFRFS